MSCESGLPAQCYLTVSPEDSSLSRSPSPSRHIKGLSLFRAIGRKLGRNIRKTKDEDTSSDDDSNSSRNCSPVNKTNQCHYSCKSGSYVRCTCARLSEPGEYLRNHDNSAGSDSCSSGEDADQLTNNNTNRNDSSSSSSSSSYQNSARKALKNMTFSTRSLSCSSISAGKQTHKRESSPKDKRPSKSPQRILRPPTSYVYVKGISGLPTHRVVNTRAAYNSRGNW